MTGWARGITLSQDEIKTLKELLEKADNLKKRGATLCCSFFKCAHMLWRETEK